MGRIIGEVTIRVNSKRIKAKKGTTLNPGGVRRTKHLKPGGGIWGTSNESVQSSISVIIAADEDVDVVEINQIEDATITWEADNGVAYMITQASPMEPFTVSDSGEIVGTFEGNAAEKI
ncbi:phage tail tube protein [Vibrio cholerae]|nr:phage tail tube protein [Vibrio cholerae]